MAGRELLADTLRQRGAEVGFAFAPGGRGRVYNTFNAHRLLHWAGLEGAAKQVSLKKALLAAYQGRGESPESPEVLLAAVASVVLAIIAAVLLVAVATLGSARPLVTLGLLFGAIIAVIFFKRVSLMLLAALRPLRN